ncbi:hypothetical protein IWQ47_004617 [Aquimarina sp. EL_43]|uniref:hypothetical protein n=1 Tax=Aquimarina TaxID=290174 RepID=UPI0004721774|nr:MULTISPECIES: hypothetical protein [Aquimarina]MBG6133209.1 hypothetical protein [Aquimarina sp. EL_35]MBG6153432.1 hypothetical protein [Aquimarina sp. EL_32]MBG6171523.1 hypothetical protein [Aquimarina sp. EL_43]
MKYIIRILFIAIIILICVGYYFKNSGDHNTGDKLVGIGILASSFILMPLFIYHRWKNKKIKDYMLTEENLKKMRDYEANTENNNR